MKNMVFEIIVNGSLVHETTDYSKAWELTRELAYCTKLPVKLVTIIK